jgi:hypothetical protein
VHFFAASYQFLKPKASRARTRADRKSGDGYFTNVDLQSLLGNLKSGDGSADPVPEPALMMLLVCVAVMGLGIVGHRRYCGDARWLRPFFVGHFSSQRLIRKQIVVFPCCKR